MRPSCWPDDQLALPPPAGRGIIGVETPQEEQTMGFVRTGAVVALSASLALAGCASMEDFATNPDKGKTRAGTGYGAAAGAVIGLLTAGNNPFKSAMIGAAAGALVGGTAGYYMDEQEKKLKQQLAGTGVDVVRKGENITLDMPGNVTFALDSADVNGQFKPVLDKVAGTLREYNKTVIEVAGHTDSSGSDEYNQKLSERRAGSVAAYLASQGVDAGRMVTVGAGEGYPVASNDTPDGRAQNRRVEITIVPVTEENVKKAQG
jgi:outer membrane protein OmpA-like peptidoglycan-associated protein